MHFPALLLFFSSIWQMQNMWTAVIGYVQVHTENSSTCAFHLHRTMVGNVFYAHDNSDMRWYLAYSSNHV